MLDFPLEDQMSEPSDLAAELFNCKQQLSNMYYDKSRLELELSQTKSELDFLVKNQKDLVLYDNLDTTDIELKNVILEHLH